jgi:hypothetical protein
VAGGVSATAPDPSTELLRAAIAGLLVHAEAAEAAFLAAAGDEASAEHGDAAHWAAAPLVAHNTEFKRQQAARLEAVLAGVEPPAFAEFDHHSPAYYAECGRIPPDEVAAAAQLTTARLLAGLRAVPDEDLLDPSRHAWLRGRRLSLQVIVRGFWHPLGHLGDFHLDRGDSAAAYALHEAAIAEAARPGVPDAARGMAYYSLGCAQARAGAIGPAAASIDLALSLNPDLSANLATDPDLAPLRIPPDARGTPNTLDV